MIQATVLSKVFDPNRLAPGYYVIASNAHGYGLARALADEKLVDYRGERYVTTTVKEMLFAVRGKRVAKAARASNPSVQLDAESFGKATDSYVDWKVKWWREAIQNGVDAGATTIRCEAHVQSDGSWLVSCEDNGRGMDREMIEHKLMRVGGSGKRDESGSVGGFGAAKNMLLYTWPEWEIRSLDSMVQGVAGGKGSDFVDISKMKGTRITVRMPADKYTDAPLAIAYITRCDLPHVRFYVNGEEVKARLRGKKLVKDEPEFQLFFNQGDEKTSAMIVRARGTQFQGSLYLFDVDFDIEIGGQVIVDLLLPTVKILTDNRDGFNTSDGYWTKTKLTAFAKELTIEGKLALRAQKTLISQAFRGEGKFQAETREAQAAAAVGATTAKPADIARALANFMKVYGDPEAKVDVDTPRAEASGGLSMPMATPEATRVMLESIRGPTNVEAAIRQVVWRPDFFLRNEVPGFKVPKEFMPASMSPRIVKLLSVWTDLCRFVMMQLGSSKTFGVGYLFSVTSGAAYLRSDGGDWLLLNPYRDVAHQKALLRPSNGDDLSYLYASAIHEATHMADGLSLHGLEFAYAFTRNTAKCARGWKVVKRIERATKLGVVAKVGAGAGAAGEKPAPRSKAAREAAKARKPHIDRALAMRRAGENTSDVIFEMQHTHGLSRDEAGEIADESSDILYTSRMALLDWAVKKLKAGRRTSDVRDMLMYPKDAAPKDAATLRRLARAYAGTDELSWDRARNVVDDAEELIAREGARQV